MKPLFARCTSKDHLVSKMTNIHSYIVEFKVKFDNGRIEEIRLNTDQNFQKIISCTKSRGGTFFEPVTLAFWQVTLFNCWRNTNQDLANCLYSFQELDNINFDCEVSSVSADELETIFSNPKSWCAVL